MGATSVVQNYFSETVEKTKIILVLKGNRQEFISGFELDKTFQKCIHIYLFNAANEYLAFSYFQYLNLIHFQIY